MIGEKNTSTFFFNEVLFSCSIQLLILKRSSLLSLFVFVNINEPYISLDIFVYIINNNFESQNKNENETYWILSCEFKCTCLSLYVNINV